jgi:hypothetical protein
MYSLYIFAFKTILTISTSSLAFSVGFLNFSDTSNIECKTHLLFGWGMLLLSIFIVFIIISAGIKIYYDYFNNLLNSGQEGNDRTYKAEQFVGGGLIFSFILMLIGIISILLFAYGNI